MALVLPMFLSPVRSVVPHSLLVAVISLVVVVTGFVGGRGAALTAAFVGALSFDAFLTETNGELRPDRMAFWTTLAVFVVAGVLASVLRPARR
jgi:K+-sensing histidine kinase KdpD